MNQGHIRGLCSPWWPALCESGHASPCFHNNVQLPGIVCSTHKVLALAPLLVGSRRFTPGSMALSFGPIMR